MSHATWIGWVSACCMLFASAPLMSQVVVPTPRVQPQVVPPHVRPPQVRPPKFVLHR